MSGRELLLAIAATVAGCTSDRPSDDPRDASGPPESKRDVEILDASAPDEGRTTDGSGADALEQTDASAESDAGPADGGFAPPAYNVWVKLEPPGAVCANGSPYKFFVNFSRRSSNVIVYFEGGGACWDYASCTGTGARTAANRDGIDDDYANKNRRANDTEVGVDLVYPLLNPNPVVSPMADWNKVFIPYCTGDVYSGNTTVTYRDPEGVGADLEFHHVGHTNVLAVIQELSEMFTHIPKLFVGGCSAGGAGALTNYYFIRNGLDVGSGYLLDDSGPLFPDTSPTSRSGPLHARVRAAWAVDDAVSTLPRASELASDLGALPAVLAAELPNDRIAQTLFRLDYNYSLYSYERFYERGPAGGIQLFGDGSGLGPLGLDETIASHRAAVYSLWWDDVALLRAQFEALPNLGYFVPFYRTTNHSHCVSIPGFEDVPEDQLLDLIVNHPDTLAWAGSDLFTGTSTITLKDYVTRMLDDTVPLGRHFEERGEGRYLSCTPLAYDAASCAAAVSGE
ncbi:MAG: hypothetical protein HYV07_32890 [Deltaproteobacteria bacterium]|nr:hypothetical protein [Deltaproteobacteria bacterium]